MAKNRLFYLLAKTPAFITTQAASEVAEGSLALPFFKDLREAAEIQC